MTSNKCNVFKEPILTNFMVLKVYFLFTARFLDQFRSHWLHQHVEGEKYAIGMINSQTIPSQEKNLPKFEESIMENI